MKRGLGRGLDAIFAENSAETGDGGEKAVLRLSEIEPNKGQPRKRFNEEALAQLADSISQHGILQPLVVRPVPGGGTYQLVAGERRWRAARMAGLSEAPVIIRELSDEQVTEIALIENLQREDLNPIEEAEGYKVLMEKYSLTQDEVSRQVGKSRPAIANALRLLNLPAEVAELVQRGELSQGHARALLALENTAEMKKIAKDVVAKELSVRSVEKLVKQKEKFPESNKRSPGPSLLSGEIERALTELLGRKVRVVDGKSKGIMEIEYYGEDDLKLLSRVIESGIEHDKVIGGNG